ncbi:winged helix-turn-helix domain-containing protein [Natroniella acetigena]|uniref:winged helix-turn-helix domain-containing protein n=1 Tax=Natroniella acetigena TaxID=52004 RepID=UPI00200AEAAC|nr:winged helix-turn-helix domain-containing protein [Natroniella acetigena]MCK8827571.1 winged helix-turn-helix domain-containing protein [Natroniella acetigena]
MPLTITDTSYEALEKMGTLLNYSQLTKKIEELVTVKDSDSVRASIYNDSRFVKFASGKLGLRKWLLSGISFVLYPSLAQIKRGFISVNNYEYLFSQSKIKLIYQKKKYCLELKNSRITGFKKLYNQLPFGLTNLLIEIVALEQGSYILKDTNIEIEDNNLYKSLILRVLKERGIKRAENLLKEVLIRAEETGRLEQLLPLVPLEEVAKEIPQIYQPAKGLFKVNKFY